MDGSIQVYYGNGRGKTTAALGLGIRAAGVGKQVIMVQFLKKKHSDTLDFLKKLEPELQISRYFYEQLKGLNFPVYDISVYETPTNCSTYRESSL